MAHFHGVNNETGNTKNLRVAFFLNLSFTIIEFIGGFLTNSVAILSDALHDLGDSFSLGLSWYFQHLSNKDSNKKFTYGYKRYTVMGALINSAVLLVGCIIIFNEAIPRILDPQVSHAPGMMLLAVLGIIANGLAVLRLRKGSTLNEKAVALHLLEDVLGWVAVLVGAIIMYFFEWPVIDPILSIGIAIYILFNIYRNLKEVLHVILQTVPKSIHYPKIEAYLENHSEIKGYHDIHVWSLDGEYNIMSVHLIIDEKLKIKEVLELKHLIRHQLADLNIQHVTIEIDYDGHPCDFIDD